MRGSVAIGLFLGSGLGACHGAPSQHSLAIDASTPSASASDTRSANRRLVAPRTPGGAACRAIAVDGDVRVAASGSDSDGGETRLAAEDTVGDGAWLSLAKAARLVLKDPQSLRETMFLGPGRARGCVSRRNESWLGAGRFEGSLGGGEMPSAEEWVITPLGVLRYVSAKVDVDATPDATTAAIAGGTCFFWSADDTRAEVQPASPDGGAVDTNDPPWRRVAGGVVRIVPAALTPPLLTARSAIDRCSERASHAEQLARILLARDAGAIPSGQTVAEQVRARRIAHASCAVAAVRLDLLAPSSARDSLAGVLAQADQAWSSLPR